MNPNEPYYWYACLGGFLFAFGCIAMYFYRTMRTPDPNKAPLAMRLEHGKLVGMPLGEFDAIRSGSDRCSASLSASATEIQNPP